MYNTLTQTKITTVYSKLKPVIIERNFSFYKNDIFHQYHYIRQFDKNYQFLMVSAAQEVNYRFFKTSLEVPLNQRMNKSNF